VFGGIVGGIASAITKRTVVWTLLWTVVGAISFGILLGVFHYKINLRERFGGRSQEEVISDTIQGALCGLVLGGLIASGVCALLATRRYDRRED
jgi:hypothetical protein